MSNFVKIFPATEGHPHQATYDARHWLTQNGYSVGSGQADAPAGILKGDYLISKMRNMTKKEQSELDGHLYTGHSQDAKIVIKRNQPEQT